MTKNYSLNDLPIYLREFTEEDITDRYLNWFKDEKFTHFLEAKNLTRQQVIDHLKFGQKTGDYYMYAVVVKETDQHIGNIKLGPIDRDNRISDLSTVIGERNALGKGYARAAIKIANLLAFEVHGIRKLSAKIQGDNIGSIKAYTGGGWAIEGRLVEHLVVEGQPKDVVLVACFNTFKENVRLSHDDIK